MLECYKFEQKSQRNVNYHNSFLPLANDDWDKVMFLHLSACSRGQWGSAYGSLHPAGGGGVYLQGVCLLGGLATGGDLPSPPTPRNRKAGSMHPNNFCHTVVRLFDDKELYSSHELYSTIKFEYFKEDFQFLRHEVGE